MIGPAGSGKSTHAKQLVDKGLASSIVSTDAIRQELYGSENEQSGGGQVFDLAEKRIREALGRQENVVIDATNLNRKSRARFVKAAKDNNASVHAMCVDISEKSAKAQNQMRDRKVPEWVIEDQFKKLSFPDKDEVNSITWIRKR